MNAVSAVFFNLEVRVFSMQETRHNGPFKERFAQHIDFQAQLFRKLDPEGKALNAIHCENVARRLFNNGADEDTVFAALLHNLTTEHFGHDRMPDLKHVLQSHGSWNRTQVASRSFTKSFNRAMDIVKSYRQIVEDAGSEVNVSFALAIEDQNKLKASLLRVADLCDRLDVSDPRKVDVAEHVYVPWANVLGFIRLSESLGEKIVKTRDPIAYKKIKSQLDSYTKNEKVKRSFTELKTVLGNRLRSEGIDALLEPRGESGLKSVYSIYRKMKKYQLPVGNEDFDHDVGLMHDLFGLRVRVVTTRNETEEDAKRKLGRVVEILHELDSDDESRMKISKVAGIDDYVENPKPSGYQAIHVPVRFGRQGLPGEIHLVTDEMHYQNEYGIPSSHLWYKLRNLEDPLRAKLVSINENLSRGVAVEDLFETQVPMVKIRLHTPSGEVNRVEVPRKATAADVWFYLNLPKVIEATLNPRKPLGLSGAVINGRKADLHKPLYGGEDVMFSLGSQPMPKEKITALLGRVTTAQAENALKEMLETSVAASKRKRK